jgi:transaldolase
LIGPETVNTVPAPTLDAILGRRGDLARTIDAPGAITAARAFLARLDELGIDLRGTTDRLEAEGVASFAMAYDAILRAIEGTRA